MKNGIRILSLVFTSFLISVVLSCGTVNNYTVSSSQVTLVWEDRSLNELGFRIERKIGSEGIYQEIATVGPNVTNYTDSGLGKGRTYYYRVRAYNLDGHSTYSEEICVEISTI